MKGQKFKTNILQILIRLAHLALCGVGPLSQQHTISTCVVLTQQGVLCSRLRASSALFPAKRLYLLEFLSVPLYIFTQLRPNHPLSGHKFSARYLFSFQVCQCFLENPLFRPKTAIFSVKPNFTGLFAVDSFLSALF